ncbi:MAG: hypothetical protein RLZZ227_96, partial [Pseudomonadota bacterium]
DHTLRGRVLIQKPFRASELLLQVSLAIAQG